MSVDSISAQQTPLAGGEGIHPASLHHRHPRLPTHFFVGTLLLYAVVLGTFLLTASPLQDAMPNWRTVVPVAAGMSFYIASNLFLMILGRGRVSRWTVLIATGSTLILTILLCVVIRSKLLEQRVSPDATTLRSAMAALVVVATTFFSRDGVLDQSVQYAGMIALEEAIKLGPVFWLIATGKIRDAHAAMLCGALCGLTFGTVEAINYGYLIYPTSGQPVTAYLTRFFVMSPLHGIWDSLAGGLVFFLSGRWRSTAARGPMIGAFAAAYMCAVVFHVAHNSLQQIIGAQMQVVTVFALLAPLYMTAKFARRRAAAEGAPDTGQLVGDLHLLTVSLATMFLAASVAFHWATGVKAHVSPANPQATASAG